MKRIGKKLFFVIVLIFWLFILVARGGRAYAYDLGVGANIGSMGKDFNIGVTVTQKFGKQFMLNLYGAFDYRLWGACARMATGSTGIGLGYYKDMIRLDRPIYWNRKKKKYFKQLGVGITFDIGQKFSSRMYIGGRYGVTVWGRLNRNMIGWGLGIDETKGLGLGIYGRAQFAYFLW